VHVVVVVHVVVALHVADMVAVVAKAKWWRCSQGNGNRGWSGGISRGGMKFLSGTFLLWTW
jgi:GT2 family glycosyltransferase